ncbi:MAG: non-canonical purine NTP pyrophosphatase [Candidatus Eremiobacteraeota bacterium]|nr:non-canonical purine NTP pyrophosphatase [Candidatus Eremiobacteraeota bacterium]
MLTYAATKNAGKLAELRAIFADSPLELAVYPAYGDVEEGSESYAANARLKARALFDQLRAVGICAAVLADDSGLEVTALGNRPGVLSARYGGVALSWPERRKKLLNEMRDVEDDLRTAKFVSAIAVILPSGELFEGHGEVRGSVARVEQGTFGFGYDPVFFYPPSGKLFSQLSEEQKNRVSHRYNAACALLAAMPK